MDDTVDGPLTVLREDGTVSYSGSYRASLMGSFSTTTGRERCTVRSTT